MNKLKTVFAVCTRNRPEMLKRCLATVVRQDIPDRLDVEIVVIDNSEDPEIQGRNDDVVNSLPASPPAIILRETRTGIPFARNKAVERAIETGADALVFLDDDQTVPHDWLSVVSRVVEEENADAVKSGVTFILEESGRFSEHLAERNGCLPGYGRIRGIRYVSTNGVWISSRLFGELGLRFDENLGFLGCDDTAFFLEAHKHGAKIVSTDEVYAQEIILGDKQNLRWLTRRNFRGGVSRAVIRLNDKSRVYYLLSGIAQALLYGSLAIALIWRQSSSTRYYMRAVRTAGMAWGALGGKFDAYRHVTGR